MVTQIVIMDQKGINIDYIGVVKECNGTYKFEQIPIVESFSEIKEKLRAMCDNPNRTLLDMQEAFAMSVQNNMYSYKYCLPYSYSTTFLCKICYPKIISYEQYNFNKQEKRTAITEQIKNTQFASESDKQQKIEDQMLKYEKELKLGFLLIALRYIMATDFNITSERINVMNNVKMISHEKIGWTAMEYNIHKDLIIKVKTNFGYGISSYFFVNVCYKGVDFLPYSQTVNYYYANMQDIIAHTRSYRAERDSWNIALDFVADISNRTQAGLERVAYEWLQNEITEMIDGLQYIKREPQKALETIIEKKSNSTDNLISVRNIYDNEINYYNAYSAELVLVFKMEKLSNALCLLNKLEQSAIIYPDAIRAVQVIKELNQSIVPELVHTIENVESQIASLQEKLAPINIALSDVKIKKEDSDKFTKVIYNRLLKRDTDLKWDAFITRYSKKHPELQELEKRIKELSDDKDTLVNEINGVKKFLKRLQACYINIDDAGLLAA